MKTITLILLFIGCSNDDRIAQDTVVIGSQTWIANDLDGSRFYTWYELSNACPNGYKVPGMVEWNVLFNYYGGQDLAGKEMIEGLFPGMLGYSYKGIISKAGTSGYWWTSSESGVDGAWSVITVAGDDMVYTNVYDKKIAMCVRCIKE